METRKPKTDTTTFSVRLNGVPRFRRCGIEFTTENTPFTVERASLTDAQALELLNTHTLKVEELGAPAAPAGKGSGK